MMVTGNCPVCDASMEAQLGPKVWDSAVVVCEMCGTHLLFEHATSVSVYHPPSPPPATTENQA